MQYEHPHDISFINQYNWSNSDEDIEKALEIMRCDDMHKHAKCPATRDNYHHVSWALAGHPETPPAVLDHMSTHTNHWKLLERIAANCALGNETLLRLALHPSSEVRQAVAEHHDLDREVIDILKRDDHTDVRYTLAENHTLPPDVLTELTVDDNPYVAHRADMTRRRTLAQYALTGSIKPSHQSPSPLKRAL